MKHYNGRWFLICATDSDNFVLTFALDRIDEFVADPVGRYKECPTDLRRRFDDIVGVTCYLDRPVEDVILWVSSDGFPYLLSKPLHPSQIVISDSESGYLRNKWRQLSGGSFVRMRCIVNPELEQAIMAYADELVVLSPQSLRESIRQKIFRLKSNYLL